MNIFLAIQNNYDELQLALMQNTHPIASCSLSKIHASTHLISTLSTLLDQHKIKLNDLPFIAVNQGPGPFTTLRTVIVSMNGLSFASKIPLVGIDGLTAFIKEYEDQNYPHTIVLLNAFGNDVYFALQAGNHRETGYHNIDTLLLHIKQTIPDKTIRFLGSGTQLYQEKIISTLGNSAHIPDPLPMYVSITQIGIMGFEHWQENPTGTHQLLPLYLKKHPVESAII